MAKDKLSSLVHGKGHSLVSIQVSDVTRGGSVGEGLHELQPGAQALFLPMWFPKPQMAVRLSLCGIRCLPQSDSRGYTVGFFSTRQCFTHFLTQDLLSVN